MFTFYKKNNTQGFTIVEMLVAVFIFSVSLVALMGVSAKGLKASKQAQSQVRADYLALEAIEVVRNLRDSAFLKGFDGNTWTGVFQGINVFSESGCYSDFGTCNFYFKTDVTPNVAVLQTCTDGCPVYYNEGTNSYFQPEAGGSTSTSTTPYTRTIVFDSLGASEDDSITEVLVTVTVAWDGGEVVYTQNLHLWS